MKETLLTTLYCNTATMPWAMHAPHKAPNLQVGGTQLATAPNLRLASCNLQVGGMLLIQDNSSITMLLIYYDNATYTSKDNANAS